MSDTFLTAPSSASASISDTRVRKGNPGQPHCIVRHQSASVPIYAGDVHGKTRYTLSYFLDGRRKRRMFTDLDAAKREAKLVAEDRVYTKDWGETCFCSFGLSVRSTEPGRGVGSC